MFKSILTYEKIIDLLAGEKMIMPHEACALEDTSKRPFSTLMSELMHSFER